MISILELKDIHAGRPGAVLGGGPSLKADMLRLPEEAVRIVLNHHQAPGATYRVFIDDPEQIPKLGFAVRNAREVRVSWRKEWSDVDFLQVVPWLGIYGSSLATWLADWTGCDPVLLCGCDCYQGERSEGADPRDLAYTFPLEQHLDFWRQAFTFCQYPERIKAVSGPLVEIFGKWDA
jgi:hypothetical protein